MDARIKSLIKQHYQANFSKKRKPFIPGKSLIPASGKAFDAEDMIAMTEAVLEGWWTEGHYAAEFEQRFAKWLGQKHCILTNSGSSANLLALSALTSFRLKDRRLKPGDEVITIAAGFPTTVNPIIINRLVPVFVDVDLATLNIDIRELKKAISRKTKAIFIPHNIGNPFNVKAVLNICRAHKLWLIEDCCDALDSKYNGQLVGTFGDLATFSFYAGHHLAMGEGGAITTSDAVLARAVKSIRDWGRDCWCQTGHDDVCGKRFSLKMGKLPYGYDHKFIFSEVGYNLKITDIQAALGLNQFKKLKSFTAQRRKNFDYLIKKFKPFERYFVLPKPTAGSQPSWFGFYLTLKPNCPFARSELIKYLEDNKIVTRLILAGNLVRQPYFQNYKIKYRQVGKLTATDTVMNQSFWVGLYHGLGQPQMDYIYLTFKKFLQSHVD